MTNDSLPRENGVITRIYDCQLPIASSLVPTQLVRILFSDVDFHKGMKSLFPDGFRDSMNYNLG